MFDVDKLYIMLPEFRVNRVYDIKKAWNDFYNDPANKDINDEIDRNLGIFFEEWQKKNPDRIDVDFDDFVEAAFKQQKLKRYDFSETAKQRFKSWFKSRKADYITGKTTITKVQYDFNKPAKYQSRQARNNALIDLMWGVLTNPDTAPQILRPGGFEEQSKAARIVTILANITPTELKQELGSDNITKLLELDRDTLDGLANKYKKPLNPLSPVTQVILHQQNMTGAAMIGIYANHNASHAMAQHTQLAINPENTFTLFDREYSSLHNIKNERGEFISGNNANFLAASVDNVKDNTLHATNQNSLTGDPSMLLSRLGYNPEEIAIFMRQPIIMDITRKYFREKRDGKNINIVVEEVIKEYATKGEMYLDLQKVVLKNHTFPINLMMQNIVDYKNLDSMDKLKRLTYLRQQTLVGMLFKEILKVSSALSDMVNSTRADTSNGGAGPTIADTMVSLIKTNTYLVNAQSEKYPLIFGNVIESLRDDILGNVDMNQVREKIKNSPIPLIQAFYTLGVESTERFLNQYFPQYTKSFKDVINGTTRADENGEHEYIPGLLDYTVNDRLSSKQLNNIYNDLLAYVMSKTEFFGSDSKVNTASRRENFINNFPQKFEEIRAKHPEIASLGFISRLKVQKPNRKTPVPVLVFKNVGSLSPDLRDSFMRDWASLLYMSEEARDLALNLFRYSYYRNGFAFGPNTFIHLAPTAVRLSVPEYKETLESLLTSEDDLMDFVEQYIYNHLDDRTFVPEIPDDTTVKFTEDEGKKIKDTVTFTINENSNSSDKKVVKDTYVVEGVEFPVFISFITKKINGNYVYYKFQGNSTEVTEEGETIDPTTGIYKRIEPLGYKNNFIEYEYGKTAQAVESVIDRNKIVEEDTKADSNTAASTTEESEDAFTVKANKIINEDINAESFGRVFNETPPNANSSDNDITNIAPNTEYRDANNNKICG